jgi:hypothetical protein
MRSQKRANHNTCDRLVGRPLGPSGGDYSGEAAARCDVEGSERQLLLRKRQSRRAGGAGGEERWTVESELLSYGRARACISLANTHPTQDTCSIARRRALSNVNPPRGPLHWRTNTSSTERAPLYRYLRRHHPSSARTGSRCRRGPNGRQCSRVAPTPPAAARSSATKLYVWQPGEAGCTFLRAS